MKRKIIVLGAALAASGAANAGRIDPDLLQKIQHNPGGQYDVIVRFRLSRTQQGRALFQSLRSQLRSAIDQLGPLSGVVNSLVNNRLAGAELWLDQSILIKTSGSVVRGLALLPVVDEVFENFPVRLVRPQSASATSAPAGPPWHLQKIGAPQSWAAGFRGQGVRVGHLDTGIDPNSPELQGRLAAFAEFAEDGSRVQGATPHDTQQHGTHTAGLIAGKTVGVAPDAKLISALVLPNGEGTFAQVIAGMQWVIDPDNNASTDDGANVVSMSLGLPGTYQEFVQPVKNMLAAGIVPVFAIGNFGPNAGSTASPGNIPEAIGVGAIDQNNNVPAFSSRGPVGWTGAYTGTYVKPDVVAPGFEITSSFPGGGYGSLSGTSQAAPIAAGAVADLLSAKPGAGVDAIKNALFGSATHLGSGGKNNTSGYGLVNLPGALAKLGVSASQPAPQPTPQPQPNPQPQPTPQPQPAPQPAPQPQPTPQPPQSNSRPTVLLVDDDAGEGADVTAALRGTIRALATSPLRWDVASQGPVPLEQLKRAEVVIWATGEAYQNTITAADQTTLRSYLQGGGRLIVAGQDIGYDIGTSSFYRDTLGTQFVADSSGTPSLTLSGPLGSGTYTLNGQGSAVNQYYPDVIAPLGGSVLAASWGGATNTAGNLQPQSIRADQNRDREQQKVTDARGLIEQVATGILRGFLNQALQGNNKTRQPAVRAQSAGQPAGAIVLNEAGRSRTIIMGFGLEGLAPQARETLLRSAFAWLTR